MREFSKNNIAGAIRNLRKSHGLKLREVYSGTGITISQLSDMELGRTAPSIRTLLILAGFYEIDDMNYFFESP